MTSLNPKRCGSPSWSPDGQMIAFDLNMGGPDDIYIINKDGGSPKRLTTEKSSENIPRWSKDGKCIYFYSDRTGRQEIWKMSLNGEKQTQITKNGGNLGYESSDGRWLYFSKRGINSIWRIPIKGGEEIKITGDNVHWRNWILAGGCIYYQRYQRNSGNRIIFEYLNLKTGKVTKIAEIRGDNTLCNYIDVSPDRSWILFTKYDPVYSDIMLVKNFR